ncbi:hypothetical protein NA78x_002056 [Anatilimnocola sp. NA78]|uniref:hypothetical protein n=1 Tax=Anatilimnocola sp. NA78 TaxID=3415683 RepID=UPI003CE4647B
MPIIPDVRGQVRMDLESIVRSRSQLIAVALVWTTALLLLVQPLAASHCSCPEVAPKNGAHACDCHDAHDGHQHCSHGNSKFRPTCTIAHSLPVSEPCDCPTSCPCRLQHSPAPLGMVRSTEIEKQNSSASLLIESESFAPRIRTANSLLLAYHQPTLFPGRQLCSLLCRLTI